MCLVTVDIGRMIRVLGSDDTPRHKPAVRNRSRHRCRCVGCRLAVKCLHRRSYPSRGDVMIRVLAVKDVGYFGVPVRALLTGAPGITYVGTLPFGPDVVGKAAELSPDVIVIDTEYMVSQVLPIASDLHARIP